LFYDIYKRKKSNLNYKFNGIKSITVVIYPEYEIKVPLDVIFKNIHSNLENPLIKYNPSSRQENMYRLYSNTISTDGRKIPFLSKTVIFKLIKTIGKNKSVCVFIDQSQIKHYNISSFIVEFNENCNISISAEFNNVLKLNDIQKLFQEFANPVITELKLYLQESGYQIGIFDNFENPNIDIIKMNYETQIEINKPININSIKSCLNSIFIVETNNPKKDIILRFKRVSNFNKKTSQEAYIIEKRRENTSNEEIIQGLIENYNDFSVEEATDLLRKMINESELEKKANRRNSDIKINPGFKTIINLNKYTSVITITVENINNLHYLSTIPIYLDSFVRLTQDKSSTDIPIKEINKLCSSKENELADIENILVVTNKKESQVESEDNNDTFDNDNLQDNESQSQGKTKNILDLFYNSDNSEDMSSDDEEEEEFSNQKGGSENSEDISAILESPSENENNELELSSPNDEIIIKTNNNKKTTIQDNTNEVKNIDGMNINNPYYFQNRIQQRDPVLILTKPEGNFTSYSRVCPSTTKRQPVILNQEELDKINKEHEGFLKEEDIVKYGSDEDHQYYYICPRYWCLKTNTVIDPKEMKDVVDKDGKIVKEHPTCGKVIPKGEKKVKPGYYVYEFYTPPKGKTDFKKYPGFQQDSHPKGFCLPCCFNNWDTPDRIGSKTQCEKKSGNEEKDEEIKVVKNINEDDIYIKGPDKFPLSPGRWGYLPIAIQKILNDVNSTSCQSNKLNTNISNINSCLLRHGVEVSDNQSFISCIADALFYAKKNPEGVFYEIPNIKEMKDIIIKAINIDKFITYQNGNLVTNFYKLDYKPDISKYSNTEIYTKINIKNPLDIEYFTKIVSAYENFLEFLKNDEVIIDYTYLWDIISKPNNLLFTSGVNLVILKIPNNDITNNVELLCPTNHYSNEFYETRKPTLILLNQGNIFEPIYLYKNDVKKKIISKIFSEYDPNLSPSLRAVFKKIIKPYLQNMCIPLASMPNVYKAKRPLLLYNLIQIIYKLKYDIVTQVVNYNSQVIGIVIKPSGTSKKGIFVPCFPSSINETYKYSFMINNELWDSYQNTIDFLINLKKKSKNEIPCKPDFRVVEDDHVVGLLTETNQFIPLSPPIPVSEIKTHDNIPYLNNENYIVNKNTNEKGEVIKDDSIIMSDAIISITSEVDKERVEYIKKIKLETNFYTIFRNTIRVLFNDYKNINLREKIENELNNSFTIYSDKLKIIIKLLHELVSTKIEFTGDEEYYKKIDEVTTCIVKDGKQCLDSQNTCAVIDNNECSLILPIKSLITGNSNEELYYGRMADELIRYERIKSFIFKPQTYLSFGNMGYNLSNNEILIIQSSLNNEYFNNLTPALINTFVQYNTFDQIEPIKSQIYDNQVELDSLLESSFQKEEKCETQILDKVKSSIWTKCFPPSYKEKDYARSVYCTYNIVIDLIKTKTNTALNMNEIKNELYQEYKKYLPNFKEKILDILIIEGKKVIGDQVKSNSISFVNFIYSDNYFLTNLDIWILMEKYKIPCFFISTKYLLETKYDKHIFLGYGNRTDNFAFIVVPGFRNEIIPNYKLIVDADNNSFFSLDNINNDCRDTIQEAMNNYKTVETYLQQFTKIAKTQYNKKKPKMKLIIEEDEESILNK
jgi:hypothetical protein